MAATHEVFNQVPPFRPTDLLQSDPGLLTGLKHYGTGKIRQSLAELGQLAGSSEAEEWGEQANNHPPELRTHDRYGHRIDEVTFHPAWHQLMQTSIEHGLHAAPGHRRTHRHTFVAPRVSS